MSDRSGSENRQRQAILHVRLAYDQRDTLAYYARQHDISMAEAVRQGITMLLGYCPACLRPLEKDTS